MQRILLTSCASFALTAGASAADLGTYNDYVEPVAENTSSWAAYFDIHAGLGVGEASGSEGGFTYYEEDSDERYIGGAARGTFFVSPSFSVQLDAWIDYAEADVDAFDGFSYSYEDSLYAGGLGAHLTYRAPTDTQLGVLASVGEVEDHGRFFNVATEAVQDIGNLRLYGQAGYVDAFDGEADTYDTSAWYTYGLLTYYLTPNLSVSGNLGYAETDESGLDFNQTDWTWGAEIEVKPSSMPFSAYAAYQGYKAEASDTDVEIDGEAHTFLVGLRFLLNRDTLREIDSATGLKDFNPLYGN